MTNRVGRTSSAPAAGRCPGCDSPCALGATLCDFCGATLGEPPRRATVTQRAQALDDAAARAVLISGPTATGQPSSSRLVRTLRASFEWLVVLLTFGFAWLWFRRRPTRG